MPVILITIRDLELLLEDETIVSTPVVFYCEQPLIIDLHI